MAKGSSQNHQRAEPEDRRSDEEKDADYRRTLPWKALVVSSFKKDLAGWLAAIFTLCLGIFAYVAWRESKQEGEISRLTLYAVQRAFINFAGMDSQPGVSTDFINIGPLFQNSGHTPTDTADMAISACVRTTALPAGFNFPRVENIGGSNDVIDSTFGAGQTISGYHFPMHRRFIAGAQKGIVKFYMWGTILYHDILPETKLHQTRFCYLMDGVSGDPLAPTPITMHFSQCLIKGSNCTDDECGQNKPAEMPPVESMEQSGCFVPTATASEVDALTSSETPVIAPPVKPK